MSITILQMVMFYAVEVMKLGISSSCAFSVEYLTPTDMWGFFFSLIVKDSESAQAKRESLIKLNCCRYLLLRYYHRVSFRGEINKIVSA